MMFSTLNQSCSRNHLHLSRFFRKQWTEIWGKFLRSAVLSAGKSCLPVSQYLSINSNAFSYSCMLTLQRRINVRKCEFHSSSCLLQEDTVENNKLKAVTHNTDGGILENPASSGHKCMSLSSSYQELNKHHCHTLDERIQGSGTIQNRIKHDKLENGIVHHASSSGLFNSNHFSERKLTLVKDCKSTSFQKTNLLSPDKVMDILFDFYEDRLVKKAALEKGINGLLFKQIFKEFRRKILSEMEAGNDEMLKVLRKSYFNSVSSDSPSKLFPVFLAFARQVHPMLNCIDQVKKISDLRGPADLFLEARAMKRRIIYHAGPTNSGKTHTALERFSAADTGVYCGPLRLLATEVFRRTNDAGIPCDLLTGEDRQWAISPEEPANHIAATVEMCSTKIFYNCAVIDEIQMIRDDERGWAWTRALLGLPCPEIHICGEHSAVDVVQRLIASCNDEMEVCHYERLSPLEVKQHRSLGGKLQGVKPGDCVVSFSQQELYRLRREIEKKSRTKCAIIYGGLPPATKVEQASKFNDPEDDCSVLVASDAIGMGLNLNIKRIVFSKLSKYDGHDVVLLTPSQAKQIAGRAGRYGSNYPNGEALTFKKEDSKLLHSLITAPTEDVKAAGLAPTMEQIEMLSQQLPDASLVKLYDVFESVAQLDGANYFMCDLEFKKKIAHKIRGLPLSVTDQYIFSTAPISTKTIDLAPKFAFNVCHEIALTSSKLKKLIKWPPKSPKSLAELQKLEAVHEGLDLYLWLSYRFPDIFVDVEQICHMQQRVEGIIGEVVSLDTLRNLTDRRVRRESKTIKTAYTTGKQPRHRARLRNDLKWLRRHNYLI
ncbi:ATP-dependent RNA helicase SUPV3L1, mitochondrial-like isoform X3 [Montipora capricornis]|uniref:ATP-dependent RNA helicase SUPV3L1, mitochondrial-like isoform X3 n=2 Tax=Montipora capricornis TaxID=246305 RepID=UPI0035F106F2